MKFSIAKKEKSESINKCSIDEKPISILLYIWPV